MDKNIENKDERYLNVILKKTYDETEEYSISIMGILKNLKRFLALWITVTIVVSIFSLIGTAFVKQNNCKKIVSLVSFTYEGVEKGLDPNGNKFNINTMKSPQIIEEALENLNMDSAELENIRKGISFEGIIPQDAIERITAYKNIFDDGGNNSLSAVEEILDFTYYPTQYKVYLDYSQTNLNRSEAAELLNQMLECYSEYFLDAYGYNSSLGNSLKTLDYSDYDYAESIDVFDSALSKISTYVKQVSSTDTTHFRSTATGYTFADITETISTLREVDLDRIASYVTLNTITKDKESLLTYYQFKVESLQRKQVICQEKLDAINDSIINYEKNTVMVFGANGTDNMNVSATEASAEYDRLFNQKNEIQTDLSTTVQSINLYEKRIERLSESTTINSAEKKERVEEELAKLNSKIELLLDIVEKTADDYYKTVVFSKAYNILVPANSSSENVLISTLKDSVAVVGIIDGIVFVIYLSSAVILAYIEEYKRNNCIKEENDKSKTTK